jgi:hypothetical protein
MALKSPSLMVQGLRSKAFSPVCLSRFLEFLSLIPNTTQPHGGEGKGEGGLELRVGIYLGFGI